MTNSIQRLWNDIKIVPPPRDGRPLLMTDGDIARVCYPKRFPRPITLGDDMSESRPGDVWEYHRDEIHIPGHTWSMIPTHWIEVVLP